MSQSSFITVASKTEITLQDIKEVLIYYKEITSKTGEQLDWNYDSYAFPYVIEEKEEDFGAYIVLRGNLDRYNTILIGVLEKDEQTHIQITLPNSSTHGDKNKANEFARFLAKKVKGTLTLFNGRVYQ